MDDLIPVINRLQDVFMSINYTGIDLPQIVVVGAQSSGKSSVLEAIVGRDFLPRGSGIVTRVPLVLNLLHQAEDEEWAMFNHDQVPITDFDDIRTEIAAETDRRAGGNKGIHSEPIGLKIFSPHVVNLTLVDLPGIAKNPVGDQPDDIERQIEDLILEHIARPNAIILAVTPANADIATSDALKLAKQVDPDGRRTLVVVTKLDLMDDGTDAYDVLTGAVIPMRLGFVGVVNRSQADIAAGVPIRDALDKEVAFFQASDAYRSIAHTCGVGHLTRRLNALLMHHIHDCLPDITTRIDALLGDKEDELASYGEADAGQFRGKAGLLLHIIRTYAQEFQAALEGTPSHISLTQLFGGARISHIFQNVFCAAIDRMAVMDGLSDDDVRMAIRNATGPRRPIFVPDAAFEHLMRMQIKRLEEPSLRCARAVYEDLAHMAAEISTDELDRFGVLRQRVTEEVHALLRDCLQPTVDLIRTLVDMEQSFINTDHPDFLRQSDVLTAFALQHLENEAAAAEMAAAAAAAVTGSRGGRRARDGDGDAGSGGAPATSGDREPETEKKRWFFDAFFSKDPPSPDGASGSGAGGSGVGSGSGGGGNSASDDLWDLQATRRSFGSSGAGGSGAGRGGGRRGLGELTENEVVEVETIKSLLRSYFAIVRKNLKDAVPKAVWLKLIRTTRERIEGVLVERLFHEDQLDTLLLEDDGVAARRAACVEQIAILREAAAIVGQVRDTVIV